jgi:hypothetical protein
MVGIKGKILMSFAPNKFLSEINKSGGLVKPSRYDVIIPLPQYINNFVTNSIVDKIIAIRDSVVQDITYALPGFLGTLIGSDPISPQSLTANPETTRHLAMMCEAAELPGKSLVTEKVKIYGPGFQVPYITDYRDMNLTFLCTRNFSERKIFDRWMEAIIPSDTNNARYPKGATSRYLTNITITQYDEIVNRIYAIQLIDAFPVGIAPQQLAWNDDNFQRLTVNFAYQRYKVIYDEQFGSAGDVASKLNELFGVRSKFLIN